jgi:glycosyltransferase involved in cell wall biosynthesis
MGPSAPQPSAGGSVLEVELSVVIPCLNEADTIGTCVAKALETMRNDGIAGEVVVADNGSTDGSQEISRRLGARVVPVPERGYGNALMGGIRSARGRYVIMGDADDSYDFREIPRYLEALRGGASLAQGCRLPSGGGRVLPGAMPFSHRWIGNPVLSFLARLMFRIPIHDIYCGMRGFTKELFERLDLRSTGMEFATEMVIKSAIFRERIAEVPTTLHRDGRIAHPPHLRTFRDGWRTLRFFLLFSPKWLFLYPGAVLLLGGTLWYLMALASARVGPMTLGLNSLLVASFAVMLGQQMVIFAIVSRTLAENQGLLPPSVMLGTFYRHVTLEKGAILGLALVATGLSLIGMVGWHWIRAGFPELDYPVYLPKVITGVLLSAMGIQTLSSSFFVSALGLARRR